MAIIKECIIMTSVLVLNERIEHIAILALHDIHTVNGCVPRLRLCKIKRETTKPVIILYYYLFTNVGITK